VGFTLLSLPDVASKGHFCFELIGNRYLFWFKEEDTKTNHQQAKKFGKSPI
jgi:hypothetical protein